MLIFYPSTNSILTATWTVLSLGETCKQLLVTVSNHQLMRRIYTSMTMHACALPPHTTVTCQWSPLVSKEIRAAFRFLQFWCSYRHPLNGVNILVLNNIFQAFTLKRNHFKLLNSKRT